MRPYFSSPERIRQLREELVRWEGTPYVGNVAVRGAGGDCVRTADAVCRGAGWSRALTWPRYSTRGEPACRLLACLDAVPELARVSIDELAAGDVIVGKSKRGGNPHLALYEGGGYLWHMSSTGRRGGWARRHRQVAERAWELLAVYRPMETEEVNHA